ncbi:hypothetical protein [Butyrivibrio sp. WCD3002]|uniref:hypothetical protein n=1 Tax=Butyrivibrio sp. WCD3002 TaxID=1280676 RepID=UPI000412E352|nr:hypothetical protein [Butyrivibrio sp. WCD3002]
MENDVRKQYKYIKTYDAYLDGDTMLVIHEDYPCLCRVNLNTHTAWVEQWLTHSGEKLRRFFYSAIFKGEKAILIPGESGRLDVVDVHSGNTVSIELSFDVNDELVTFDSNDPFFKGFTHNNFAYILGATYPGLIKLSLETNEIACSINANINKNDFIHINSKNYYFANGYAIRESIAYLPLGVVPAIGKLYLETDEMVLNRFDDEIKMVHGLLDRRKDILLLIEDDRNRLYLCKWDETNGIEERLYVGEIDNADEVVSYYWEPLEAGDDIFLIPMNKGKIYRINWGQKAVSECKTINEGIGDLPDKIARFMMVPLGVKDNKLLLHTLWDRCWHEYDSEGDKLESFFVTMEDDEYIRRWWAPSLMQQSITYETNCPLDDFIKSI